MEDTLLNVIEEFVNSILRAVQALLTALGIDATIDPVHL